MIGDMSQGHRPTDSREAPTTPTTTVARAEDAASGEIEDAPADPGSSPSEIASPTPEPEHEPADASPHVAAEALVRELTERLAIQRTAEIHGLLEIIGRKRKLFAVNLLAGLARGVGFFLGITLVGGLVIGATAMAFDFVADTLGLKDVNFTSMMRHFAEKAVEAELVWEDVRNERRDGDSPDAAAAASPEYEPAPPRDAFTSDAAFDLAGTGAQGAAPEAAAGETVAPADGDH